MAPVAPSYDDRVKFCLDAKNAALDKLTKQYGDQLPTNVVARPPYFGQDNHRNEQFGCLDQMWTGESQWDAWALNHGSGAYGIAQALGKGHIYDYGADRAQVIWGLDYIAGRYVTPCLAWQFWSNQSPHWY